MNSAHVYKVCDQPHPVRIEHILRSCLSQNIERALGDMDELWKLGYSSLDIITTIFKVLKAMDVMEVWKLELLQIVSATHMRIIDGVGSLIQLQGLCAKMAVAAVELKVPAAKYATS